MTTAVAPWPTAELEHVTRCPVCGDSEHSLMYEGLTDNVFGTAPGTWSLKQCAKCSSAFLSPRPTQASIGLAYKGYYTHAAGDHTIIRPVGRIRTFLHSGLNAYYKRRYNIERPPFSTAGRWLVSTIPSLHSAADAVCRHLPPLPPGGGHLLDVGCGNGEFLALARQAGWTTEGIDFDSEAVRTSRSRNLSVHQGSIDILDDQQERFDVITLSHVIEHVHDPSLFLMKIFDLLKPGGTLWLETPNLSSLGSRRFGRSWRGLEPPRHLVLFNKASLRKLLLETGFTSIRQRWHGLVVFNIYAESETMAIGRLGTSGSYQGRPPLPAILAEICEMLVPSKREFLTFTARKVSMDG